MTNCGPVRPSRRGKWRALVLVLVHVAVAVHVIHWKMTGRTVTPVEPSEAMQTLEGGWVNAGFVLLAASVLLTLVFGRFFCGWACHVVALQDGCAWLLKKLGFKPRPIRSRLLMLVPSGAAFYMFLWPTVKRWYAGAPGPEWTGHFTTTSFWATFPGPVISVLTLLVCGGLVVVWLGAKGFCTYGCPYGAIFATVDRVAPGRILVNDDCDGCGHCTATCTSNVRVHEEVRLFKQVVDAGCMKCLDCVDVCPRDALRFGFAAPARGRSRRAWDFTWGEEIAMAIAFVAALCAFRGLYGAVPFLFSLGLAVLAATGAMVLWRLARQPALSWQRWSLKQGGRPTRAGVAIGSLLLAFLVFAAHSGLVQWCTWRGQGLLEDALATPPGSERDELAARSRGHLALSERAGLFADPRVEHALALLAIKDGDMAGAEARLRRAADGVPDAAWRLANIVAQRGELETAERMLAELLERAPGFQPARARLDALRQEIASRRPPR